MSYYIYQTKGIILDKRDVGEADGLFSILTEDLGRIDAIAQGVRYLKSKLRYSLKKLDYSRFGLVAGAKAPDFWRIVDAEELDGFSGIRGNPGKLAVASQIIKLISRMVVGSSPDADFWKEAENSLRFLENADFKEEEMKIFGLLAELRLLSHLGYVENHEKWLNLPIEEACGMEADMSSTIERALSESQL